MTSLYLEDIFDEFGSGYGLCVNGIGYIPVESISTLDEYQSEQATRRHYNFESPIFSLSADYCLDYPDIDEDGNWNVGDDVFIPISPDMTPIQVWDTIASQMW